MNTRPAMQDDPPDTPPARLILGAFFMAARMIYRGQPASDVREDFVRESLADADELIKQAGP
jgi:hypothetical protein